MTTDRPTPKQISAKVRRAVQLHGAAETARRLGLSRGATLAVAVGTARAGTVALVQQRIDGLTT